MASSVFISGYSCGLRNEGRCKELAKTMEWKHGSRSLDLCWTCVCYLTDDHNLKYVGFCDPNALHVTDLQSPVCAGEGPKLSSPVRNTPKKSQSSSADTSPSKSSTSSSASEWESNIRIQEETAGTWIISLLGDEAFQQVTCGWNLFAAISNKGQCVVWKDTHFERPILCRDDCDTPQVHFISLGDLHSAVLGNDGKLYELIMEDATYTLTPLMLPIPVTQVSCGKEHVVILTERGTLYSYGLGSRGQLGHGSLDPEDQPRLVEALEGVTVTGIASGGWHSAALDTTGSIYLWGWNESGQLALPCSKLSRGNADDVVTVQSTPALIDVGSNKNIAKITLGSRHSAVLTDDGEFWTWGWNGYGQLCQGDCKSRDSPCRVQYFASKGLKVQDVRCRDWTTIVWVSK